MIKSIYHYYLIKRSGIFDMQYYLLHNPDVRRADIDPLWHFITIGWKEGRNPSQTFDTKQYLNQNQDVLDAGINPLIHYLKFGLKENRRFTAITPLPKLGINPKVSIIIPCFNGSDTIRETLESVLRQSYKNYEIIIVDDGSSDASLEIIAQIAPSAKIIQQENQGTMHARQAGIDASSGDLIALLDQDDIWKKDYLLIQVDYLKNHPQVGFVFSNMEAIDTKGKKRGFDVIPNTGKYVVSWESFLLINPVSLSTTLIRKVILDLIGGLDPSYGFSGALGDSDLYIRASEVTEIHFIDKILGSYRWSEMRPGRLVSFLENLVIYARKYWKHPLLLRKENAALRLRFIKSCSEYALHIFRLLLDQYENRIPRELLIRLNNYHHTMNVLFGGLYRQTMGLKSFLIELYNTETYAQRILLFLYLLRADLQKNFPSVAYGESNTYLQWARKVVEGELKDNDAIILNEFGSELIGDTISSTFTFDKEVEFPFREKPKGAILISVSQDKQGFYELMNNLYQFLSSSQNSYRVFILYQDENEFKFGKI